MTMEKKNKGWRAQQRKLRYRNRLKVYANYEDTECTDADGNIIKHPTWRDLYDANWYPALRSSGTPCSCWVCKGERYNRLKYKQGTKDEIANDLEE